MKYIKVNLKIKKTFIIIILFIVFALNGCKLISKIEPEKYKKYLEQKYGAEKNFYIVEKGTCNWFELGYCTYIFSSKSLNGATFSVSGEFKNKLPIFEDNYIDAKYKEQLKNYYYNLLKNIVNFNFSIDTNLYSTELDSNLSFEQYLRHEDLNLNLIISTTDQNIDYELTKQKVLNKINEENITNINHILIYDSVSNNYHYIY